MLMREISLSRRFMSDSFWSLFGNLSSLIAGLVAIKLITKLVSTDDYGRASLVLGAAALLNGFIIGPLLVAHLRVYFDYVKRGLARWYARVFNRVLCGAGALAFLIYVVIACGFKLSGNNIFLMFVGPVALMIFAQPFMSAVTGYLEAHRLYKRLAIANILQKVLYPMILSLLLLSAVSGPYAIIISQGLAVIPLILFFRVINDQKNSEKEPENTRKEWGNLIASFAGFGLALPLGYLVHWVLSTSDRYLIEHFITMKYVGIYTMNYGLWSMPYLMLNGWLEILTRPHVYSSAADDDWVKVKRILFYRILAASIACVIGTAILYFLGEYIASIMLGRNYWGGRKLMMYIALAHCFMVIGYSVLPVFLAGKKTKAILWATLVAALCNIGINLVLIPSHGMTGAAASTLISYFIWAGVLCGGAYLFFHDMSARYNLVRAKAVT